MSGDRFKLEVREREENERGSRNSRRLRNDGVIPGVLYGKGHARAIVGPGEGFADRDDGTVGAARNPGRRARGSEDRAPVDPRGVPTGSRARDDLPHRSPGGTSRSADPGIGRRSPRRRIGRGQSGRCRVARLARAPGRGTPDGGSRAHRRRRERHGHRRCSSPRRCRDARGGHVPRRPARDGHRERHDVARLRRARRGGGSCGCRGGSRSPRGGRGARRGRAEAEADEAGEASEASSDEAE